jgi:hypothetical protein
MKLWKISLWLSIASCLLLLLVMLLPDNFTVFSYEDKQAGMGVLFPVLLVSWTLALFGFAVNNIYIDKTIVDSKAKQMSNPKTYLPSMLGIPSYFSFVWFIIRWFKGKPHGL